MSDTETWVFTQHYRVGLPGWWMKLRMDDPHTDLWLRGMKPYDIILYNVHSHEVCKGRECIIHSPESRESDLMPLLWRSDRGIFERICPHGTGHPDPAQFAYWEENDQEWQKIHGCCLEHCTF